MSDDSIPVISKSCIKCQVAYPATSGYFYQHSQSGRLQNVCKNCLSNKQKENPEVRREKRRETAKRLAVSRKIKRQLYEQKNRERIRIRSRIYMNTVYKEKAIEKGKTSRQKNHAKRIIQKRQYYQRNREKILLKNKTYLQQHPASHKASIQRYLKKYPEKQRVLAQKTRARKRSLPSTLSSSDWQYALDYWKNSCAVCKNPAGFFWTLAMDHWIPLMSPDCPGTIASNILPLCHGQGGCNNSKGKKTQQLGSLQSWENVPP